METNSPESCKTCGGRWRLAVLILVLAAIVLSRVSGLWHASTTTTHGAAAPAIDGQTHEHVSLAVDFGNGRLQKFGDLPWHVGMTVADLMRLAPGLETTQKGAGELTFLTEIGGVANEGTDSNNWVYEVNGEVPDRSFAVFELHADDRVLWTFGPRR